MRRNLIENEVVVPCVREITELGESYYVQGRVGRRSQQEARPGGEF